MTGPDSLSEDTQRISELLREKHGVRSGALGPALSKARHRLPRRVYRQGMALAEAGALADHPKLRQTLDFDALKVAGRDVRQHLEAIDLADRRKGWWLGMAGGMAFNLLLAVALLILLLVWRGVI